jgi:CBS domain-containing protein
MKITIGSKFLFSTEKKYIIMSKVVRDIMTKYVVTIDENRTALEAAKIMAEKGISSLIVLKDQKPVGIVTERDFVKKICIKELKISHVKVNEIMSKIRTFADPEVPIPVAVQRMVNHRIRRLPIMENGKVVGIITVTDLAKYLRTMLLIEGALSEKSKS